MTSLLDLYECFVVHVIEAGSSGATENTHSVPEVGETATIYHDVPLGPLERRFVKRRLILRINTVAASLSYCQGGGFYLYRSAVPRQATVSILFKSYIITKRLESSNRHNK